MGLIRSSTGPMAMSKAERKKFKRQRKEQLPTTPVVHSPAAAAKRPAGASSAGASDGKPAKRQRLQQGPSKAAGMSSGGNSSSSRPKGGGRGKGGTSQGAGKGSGSGRGGGKGKGRKGRGGAGKGGAGYAGKHPARPGDWTCHQCYANVFGSLTDCYKCHVPRLGDPTATGVLCTR